MQLPQRLPSAIPAQSRPLLSQSQRRLSSASPAESQQGSSPSSSGPGGCWTGGRAWTPLCAATHRTHSWLQFLRGGGAASFLALLFLLFLHLLFLAASRYWGVVRTQCGARTSPPPKAPNGGELSTFCRRGSRASVLGLPEPPCPGTNQRTSLHCALHQCAASISSATPSCQYPTTDEGRPRQCTHRARRGRTLGTLSALCSCSIRIVDGWSAPPTQPCLPPSRIASMVLCRCYL